MSDLSLIDIVNLIRAEIARTEIGDVKRITGPAGERGPQGEAGIQGPQGPRGNDGKQGPAGVKGDQGKKGDKGVKGDDGKDGVGIARVEQDIDNAIVVYLTDGNFYTIEMPLINDDGSLAKEVHFKTGSGGSGQVDLSMYVRRPGTDLRDGRWLAYRETENGANKEWSPITTDMVETNAGLMFRDAQGRFAPTPDELDNLTNQLKVNRYLWDKIQELDPQEPEPEAIVGAFRFAHADGTPPLLKEGEMVCSSPWGTLDPAEIMTIRISTLDSKYDEIPDGTFEPNKEFSLYRSQAGLPTKVATFAPYMVNISSYQTGGEYYELALDTNKTDILEDLEEGVDYFLTNNVHNFDRTPATAWFGISDVRGDYVLIKEKEELDDFFADENWRFWSGYNLWANTVTEAHPYLVWKDIHSIQLPSYDVGPINYSGKTRLEEYISAGMTIKIVDRFAFENYGVYEVLEFKKVQAPSWYSWNDILDPDKDPSSYHDSYHLKVKCIEGRGESLLNKTGGSSGFGLHNEDEAELSPEEIAAVSSSPVQRFWIAKATGEGPTDRLTNRESVSTLPTFGSRYAPDQSDTLIGAFNRDYRAPDYHLDVQHYNRIDHVNSRGEEYDVHYGGGTTAFIGQAWTRYDKSYYEFTYDWSSKPGAGRDLDNFNHVQVQDPETPVNKARTTVTFSVESVPRVRFYCSDTEDENSIVTEIKTAVAIGASRKTHPLYMYWREEFDNTHYYNQIKRLGDPSEEYDATNKKYVDGKVGRMVSRSAVAEAFTKIQRAVSDETTLEGLKQSLVNSLGGLIEEFEHEHD